MIFARTVCKTRKKPLILKFPAYYLIEYFNGRAGPFQTCTTSRRTRQPSDLRRSRSKGGRSISRPDLPTVNVRGERFWARTRTRGGRGGCSELSPRYRLCSKSGAGNPLTTTPLTAFPHTSPPRHPDVTSLPSAPAPRQPPRCLATASSCHRVPPPWPSRQRHVITVRRAHHDVMLTSSAEKRQSRYFAKFNVITGLISRF